MMQLDAIQCKLLRKWKPVTDKKNLCEYIKSLDNTTKANRCIKPGTVLQSVPTCAQWAGFNLVKKNKQRQDRDTIETSRT